MYDLRRPLGANRTRDGRSSGWICIGVSAYTREVVHGELLARFDVALAELLSPSEWADISRRLYRDRHDPQRRRPEDKPNG